MSLKREVWVDYIKIFACILVVLGHFFQSMVKANILPDSNVYQWFNTTIYYFHVPLFFICSGYLYQRYSKVTDGKSWIKNVGKKAATLGIPYFIFSIITWLLKTMFSESVNTEIRGLGDALFLNPISPYWYLYVLFFLFVITPTIKSNKDAIYFVIIGLVLKSLILIEKVSDITQIYAISGICRNEIWFVLGMILAVVRTNKIKKRLIGTLLGLFFVILSLWTFMTENNLIEFGMGLLACISIFMLLCDCDNNRCVSKFSRYTMPIFLMHTLFAAPIRAILLRIGINNAIIHVVIGIIISLFGPIVAIILLERTKMDWIIYPLRLMKKGEDK